MSETPDISQALVGAVTSVINALAQIVGGVATAIQQYANTIGTVVVVGGLAVLAWNIFNRSVPFLGRVIGRLF